jgi:predicted outer membrane repeat protein
METKILPRIGAGRSQRRRTNVIGSISMLLFCLLFATSFLLGKSPVRVASAASRTVACGNTAGLIDAINDANATLEADTIALTIGCTYQLTGPHNTDEGANGLPSITSPITINGNGATIARATTSPTPSFRIFRVAAGGKLTLNNLTVRNGSLQSSSKTTNQVVVTGGAILNSGGTLTVNNSVIENNVTVGQKAAGGAIQNSGAATTTITNSSIRRNSASFGGAIAGTGTLKVTSSTLNDNTASRHRPGQRANGKHHQ